MALTKAELISETALSDAMSARLEAGANIFIVHNAETGKMVIQAPNMSSNAESIALSIALS
jgi:hypothetical protein